MERHLQFNEAFLEIYGNAETVLRLLPETTQRKAVPPDTVAACRPDVISPGGSKNLAFLVIGDAQVVISGGIQAVAYLLGVLTGVPDRSPRPADKPLTVYFLTTPCVAPYTRAVTCYAPRSKPLRRGGQPDLYA